MHQDICPYLGMEMAKRDFDRYLRPTGDENARNI